MSFDDLFSQTIEKLILLGLIEIIIDENGEECYRITEEGKMVLDEFDKKQNTTVH